MPYFDVVYSVTDDARLDTEEPYTAGMLLKQADIVSIELLDYNA